MQWRAWLGTPVGRVKGKSFRETFGKIFLHESMSSASGKVVPIWNRVAMLCVSLITGSPFAMVYLWVVAIPCHSKVLK